ncbi:Ig-like domain-containing protein, partial [Rouxiella silvae]|nr:Ig-like domain-containing protein [Rouxiella silvae]
ASVDSKGKVTAKAQGTTKVTVTEAESANYLGQAVTADVSVGLNDALVLTAEAVKVDWGTVEVGLGVKGGNEGPYIYQADSAGVVKVSDKGDLTLLKAGTTRIKVSQAATASMAAPEAIEVKVTVRKILGTVLKAEPMTLKVLETQSIEVSGGNGGTLSYSSDNPKIASVEKDGKVTAIAKGKTKVTVTEAASANYLGQAVTADVSVGLNDAPVLTAEAVKVDWGTVNVGLGVKGGNEGPYIYQADSAGVVKVSDKGYLTLLKAGTTRINVSQAATATTAAPASIKVPVTVRKILGTVLKAEPMTLKVLETQGIEVSGGNGGALSYHSDRAGIASVEKDGKVTAIAKGTAKITVTEAESANYLGQAVTADVSVGLNDAPVLTAKAVEVDFGSKPPALVVEGGNDGKLSYTSSNANVVKVSDKGDLTLVSAGQTDITVSQAATATTAAPASIKVSVTVRKILGTVLKAEPMTLKVLKTQDIKVSGGNGGTLSYSSDRPDIASVEKDGKVTAIAKGTAKITVMEAASANYLGQAVTADVSVDLNDAPVLHADPVSWEFGTVPRPLYVQGGNDGKLSFTSADESIVAVNSRGDLVFVKGGTTSITVSQAETATTAAPEAIEVNVTVRKTLGRVLKAEPMTLKIDQTHKVKITSSNGDKGGKLSYRSDRPDIASVDDEGNVTAKAKGTAKVTVTEAETATHKGQTVTPIVTVNLKDALVLYADPVTVDFGAAKGKLSLSGSNGGKLSFSSSKENVVKVSDKGDLTFGEVGLADITVKQAATDTTAAPISIKVPVTVKHGKPVIKDLKITGQSAIGSKLVSSYNYVGNGVAEAKEKASYQWMNEKEWITGAKSKDYVITAADVGHEIYVQAITHNTLDELSSFVISNKIKVILLPSISNQRIGGSPIEGQTLDALYTLENGDAAKTEKTITWERTSGGNSGIIPGATKPQYVLTANDVGAKIRFHVTPTNSSGLKGELASAPILGPVIPLPSITNLRIWGNPIEGQTLDALYTLENGDAAKTEKTITWERTSAGSNSGIIPGATKPQYVLTANDVGAVIRFRVTATNSSGSTGGSSSSPTTGNVIPLPSISNLSISGTPIVGKTLDAKYTLLYGDAAKTEKTITWERTSGSNQGTIPGATKPQYVLTANDVGAEIRFRITATNSSGSTGGSSSSPSVGAVVNKPSVDRLNISGTHVVGQELKANYALLDGDDTETEKTIIWYVQGTVVAKGTRYYRLVANDVGGHISFEVTATSSDNTVGNTRISTHYGPIKDKPKPAVSNLSASIKSCGSSLREYTAHYDYDAKGGSDEGDTVITWTGSSKTSQGKVVCVNIYNSNGYNKMTITPKNKDGIVGDVVEKSI